VWLWLEPIFPNPRLLGFFFFKNWCTELHENRTICLVAELHENRTIGLVAELRENRTIGVVADTSARTDGWMLSAHNASCK
jgi:hypothetical protein